VRQTLLRPMQSNLSSPAVVAALLRRHGLRPQRRLGQNFLVDANVLNKICDAAGIIFGSSVLEIGPGLGVLTSQLASRTGTEGKVLSIEIDRGLLPALQETIGELEHVSILNADALSVDFDAVISEYGLSDPLHVVANIPYQITSPLLAKFLEMRHELSSVVLLVQKEVASRLAAKPGTSDYGAFTVFVQFHATVEIIGNVSSTCFFPPPEVTSTIIKLCPRRVPQVVVDDTKLLFKVVHAGFGQRRKTLLNALSNDPTLSWTREQAQFALSQSGINPERRGETLSLVEFATLAAAGKQF
jgi:16S rRNA (adenine1518-N6/adenine1519-N6)-dimethyltransferase